MSTDKQIVCTLHKDVIFRQPRDRIGLGPCSHEEADSGMMIHVADAANKYTSIHIRTVDSNVVVLLVYAFGELTSSLNEVWVASDIGNHYRLMHWREVGRCVDLPEACTVCRELMRCGCTKCCHANCKCVKVTLICAAIQVQIWQILLVLD